MSAGLSVAELWPLLLVALAPLAWWSAVRSRALEARARRRLVGALRVGTIVLLAVALTRPVLRWPSTELSIVVVVDASASIDRASRSAAREWVESSGVDAAGHAAYLALGRDLRAAESPAELGRAMGAVDPGATDLARALRAAVGLFAPGHDRRLVLLTDGNATVGRRTDATEDTPDVLAEIVSRLVAEGIEVYVNPVAVEPTRDRGVEFVSVPERFAVQEPFALDVGVFVPEAQRATVELHHLGDVGGGELEELAAGDLEGSRGDDAGRGALLGRRTVALEPGRRRVRFEVRLGRTGPQTLEARLLPVGSTTATPGPGVDDALRRSVHVSGRPRILQVEARPESGRYLRRALRSEGLEVQAAVPGSLPREVEGLEPFDAVILSDVGAGEIPEGGMETVERYVREAGGGLLLVGGERVFGEDGYSDTPVEEVLPVEFSIRRQRRDLALLIVLDKSYSMVGRKIELAKEASIAALDVLEDRHRFGLLTFNYDPFWSVPIQSASNRERIREEVSRVQASAHTNIYPALEEAYDELRDLDAEVEHVILLSDGKTYPDDYRELVTAMAEDDITVSSVAVGDEADRQLLGDIARWGRGRSYFLEDAARVPQIFTEEARIASRQTLREVPFRPVVRQRSEVLAGVDPGGAPPLRGYVRTRADDTAEVLLESPEGEPILARWQYGLGRAAAFTSDAEDRWAAEWLDWPGYGRFWAQVVRDVMRRDQPEGVRMRVRRDGDEAVVTVAARGGAGSDPGELEAEVHAVAADGTVRRSELRGVGLSTYRARFALEGLGVHLGGRRDAGGGAPAAGGPEGLVDELPPDPGSLLFRLVDADGVVAARSLALNAGEEYRFRPVDETGLRALAAATGGAFRPDLETILAPSEVRHTEEVDLWPWLASLALLLYLIELAVRRSPEVLV